MKFKLATLILFVSGVLCAQEFRATLTGRITDPSGAAVGGAKIELRSPATGNTANTLSAEDGSYQFGFLNPGEYTMTVEKAGFHRVVQEGIHLDVAEKANVNIPMQLGEVTQSVNVTADTTVVEAESADRGLTIESKRVENTPLQGRNIFAQAWSAPGIAVTASVQRLRPFDILGSSSMSISGGRPFMNEVLIDGVSNLSRAGQVAYVPPVEATGEFKVQTSTYDAQYGWTTGGIVNIVTKNGTNQWHGTAYEFLQNTHLNANSFDNNLHGIPRQSSHINTFGGEVAGPIKKDKLFFLFAYENIRQVIPDPFTTSVPSSLQRGGDFSQTFYGKDSSGSPLLQTIYNPFSTTAGPNGNLVRTPFAGNVIPGSLINPIAAKVLSIIPGGNVTGDPLTGLNNLVSNGSTRKFTDFFPEFSSRVDYNITDTLRMFVRYSRNALAEERSFHYSTNSTVNVAETSGNTPFKRENHSAIVDLTKVLSPTTVLDFRAGLARFLGESGSSIGAGYSLASLGFSPQYVSQAVAWFPKFNWANYEGAGSNPTDASPTQTNSFQITMSRVMGHHTVKTGVDFRLLRAYDQNIGYPAGYFNFDQGFTGANPISISPSSGNAIASFLLGTASGGFITANNAPARQQRMWSGFVQDDIRVSARLKVGVGLRWDYEGPMTDRFNALTRGFDASASNPLQSQVQGLTLKGGLLFAGAGGQDRGIYNKDWNNFGPRVGLAYQLNDKTVLRGGYALIYAQTWDDPGNAPGFSQTTSMVTSIQTGIPYNTLTNPYPAGILRPVGSSLGLSTYLGQGFGFADPNRVLPWTHQFSFEIQRELPGQMLLSVGYVGSRTRGLAVNKAINEIPLSALQLGASALTKNAPNPMAGLIPGTSLNGATVQQQQLLRPFPEFSSITEIADPIGQASYNGFQAMLYKRLSAGLNVSASYTWSKSMEATQFMNAQDTALAHVVSAWDIPQNLQLNGLYDLPFGKGRHFGAALPPVVNRILGGWEISGIARIQGGMPMPFPSGAQATGASPVLANPTLDRWFNTCTQLASGKLQDCQSGEQPVWTIQQPFTLFTGSPRLSSVRLRPIFNLDTSIIKNNPIGERYNLIFRTDFLNATNSVQFFNGPVTTATSGNFGRIAGAVSQSNLPRFIQLSLKFEF